MNLEEKTIEFIQKVAESHKGQQLYAGNSGGKDSAVLDYLLKQSGIEYKSYYANTTIDPIICLITYKNFIINKLIVTPLLKNNL